MVGVRRRLEVEEYEKCYFPQSMMGRGEGMCAGSPSETRGWGVNKRGDPTKGGIDKLLRG